MCKTRVISRAAILRGMYLRFIIGHKCVSYVIQLQVKKCHPGGYHYHQYFCKSFEVLNILCSGRTSTEEC